MKDDRPHDRCSNEAGTTLIECLLAVLILTIVSAGLLGVFDIAISQNKQQGEFATRATEYCQDKMEQLMALQFTDTTSNTTVFPTAATGGTGLSTGGGTTASGSPPAGTTNYYDYLDVSGNLQGTANYTTPFYLRMWQITTSGNLKTITVTATTITNAGLGIANGVNGNAEPTSTLVCLKANF